MKLDEIEYNKSFRFESILECLKSYFDIDLNLDSLSESQIKELYRKNKTFRDTHLNENIISSMYVQEMLQSKLICEAVRIYLKEIRPKRSYINSLDRSGVR